MPDSTSNLMSKTLDRIDTCDKDGRDFENTPVHQPDQLPKQFSLFTTLAFGFSMTNSWLGYSATFITPLLLGGSPTVFFGLITASIASCFISKRQNSGLDDDGALTHHSF